MTQHRIEAVGVVLDRRQERQPGELGQAGATNRWREAEVAELLEVVPGGHALILLEGVVPSLCYAGQMV
jgi:hypothetical protein